MLAEAALHVPDGCSIEWREGDAEHLPFDEASFDVVFCQQGLQFFPDRLAAVAEMRRVLRPGGTAVVSLWRTLEHNPINQTERDCIAKHVSADAAQGWAAAFRPDLDDPDVLVKLFTQAGFDRVEVEATALIVPFSDPRARVTGPLGGTPVAEQIAALSDEAYEAMITEMLATLEPWIVEGKLEAPQACNIIVARR